MVVTDRRVLDRQLQDAIYQIEHAQGVVKAIDRDSRQLAAALIDGTRIVVTTLQKFPFVLRGLLHAAGAESQEIATADETARAKAWEAGDRGSAGTSVDRGRGAFQLERGDGTLVQGHTTALLQERTRTTNPRLPRKAQGQSRALVRSSRACIRTTDEGAKTEVTRRRRKLGRERGQRDAPASGTDASKDPMVRHPFADCMRVTLAQLSFERIPDAGENG